MSWWKKASELGLMRFLLRRKKSVEQEAVLVEFERRLDGFVKKQVYGDTSAKTKALLSAEYEEIRAESLFRLMKMFPTYKGNSYEYRKYVRKVVLSVCLDVIKRDKHHGHELDAPTVNADETDTITLHETIMGEEPLPEEMMTLSDAGERLALAEQALTQMKEPCQTYLRQAFLDDMPQKWIAEKADISPNSLRTRLTRCKYEWDQKIARLMAEQSQMVDFVEQTIAEMPEPAQTVWRLWWHGERRWKQLGQQCVPPLNQSDTKAAYTHGWQQLYWAYTQTNNNGSN